MAERVSVGRAAIVEGRPKGGGLGFFPLCVTPDARRQVALWLFGMCVLVAAMVLVGGATRLTDSGLSITEWKPITGLIPPLTASDWEEEFAKYKLIPEYEKVNEGMSLDDFKFIYWWEWGHRALGRMIGAAFVVPFLWFAGLRKIERALAPKLLIIFGLGGLQGFIGWYMVQSGLSERVDVSQYRLALHLAAAFFIFGCIFWIALDLIRPCPASGPKHATIERWAVGLAGLVFLQIVLGAFVAGLHAGWTYNTWPLMDGDIVPRGYFFMNPWYINFFENHATVQFNHRTAGYAIFIVACIVYGMSRKAAVTGGAELWIRALVALIVMQIGLGIWTLLAVTPIWLALLHQAGSILVFAASLTFIHALRAA